VVISPKLFQNLSYYDPDISLNGILPAMFQQIIFSTRLALAMGIKMKKSP